MICEKDGLGSSGVSESLRFRDATVCGCVACLDRDRRFSGIEASCCDWFLPSGRAVLSKASKKEGSSVPNRSGDDETSFGGGGGGGSGWSV